MFYQNRFTERAAEALRLAQETAGQMGHSYVGSEHLLTGLAKAVSYTHLTLPTHREV